MRYILIFWAMPMGLFWAWFTLSYYDMSFGLLFLSRTVHDFAFDTYGNLLGIDPASIPPLVARACVVDTALIFGIYGFRRRHDIAEWYGTTRLAAMFRNPSAAPEADPVPPGE